VRSKKGVFPARLRDRIKGAWVKTFLSRAAGKSRRVEKELEKIVVIKG